MKKILIIENNYMMRMFLINYLGKSYDVTAVETPSESIALMVNGARFDLVVCDYYSENDAQYTDLQALHLHLNWESGSLFILTDKDKSEQRINALQNGAKDTLSKPFNPKELTVRISTLLNKSAQFSGLRTVA